MGYLSDSQEYSPLSRELRMYSMYNWAMKAHATYQVRAYTTAKGHAQLGRVMRMSASLYNAALREWRDAYRRSGVSRTYVDQYKQLTLVRRDDPGGWGSLSVHVGRGVLKRLDRARRGFYRRVERGEKPGYPRFKPHGRWNTIEISEAARGMVRPDRVLIKGLPTLRLSRNVCLPDPVQVRSLTITKRGRRLFVNLIYAVEREPMNPSEDKVGVDMGTSDRMALSTGERVGSRRRPSEILERARRRLLRCTAGSRRWRERRAVLSNQQFRERIRNRNECHRLTTEIVRRFGLIAVGDLAVSDLAGRAGGMSATPGQSTEIRTDVYGLVREQTWGLLQAQLAYKAEWAGRDFVRVDPRYVRQTCSACGVIDERACEDKRYDCPHCGNSTDADINAAVNILRRGLAGGTSPPATPESSELCAS